MKFGILIPVVSEKDLNEVYNLIEEGFKGISAEHEILFVLNGKLTNLFTKLRSEFANFDNVQAVKLEQNVNQQKLIIAGMEYCENFNATIIYSLKEKINPFIIKSFISSWNAGNKIVFVKKQYKKINKIVNYLKEGLYKIGMKILGIFKDNFAELDVQLLDREVVNTINRLPNKNKQLRVLDSFVGYNTDIIFVESLDKSVKNPDYIEKSKKRRLCNLLALIFGCVNIVIFLFAVISLSVGWRIYALIYLFLILMWIFSGFMCIVYATKSVLVSRVGESLTDTEVHDLFRNIEKYNLSDSKLK